MLPSKKPHDLISQEGMRMKYKGELMEYLVSCIFNLPFVL